MYKSVDFLAASCNRLCNKMRLSPQVLIFTVKAAAAPTIAIAICQRHSVALHYMNFGYIMVVVSIITLPMLPRAQFILNLFTTTVRVKDNRVMLNHDDEY